MDQQLAPKSWMTILKNVAIAVVLAIAAFIAYKYFFEGMETVGINEAIMNDTAAIGGSVGVGSSASMTPIETPAQIQPVNQDFPGADVSGLGMSQGSPNAEIVPMDLLPNNDAAAIFAAENPNGSGNVQNVNYLVAGFDIGMDTHGGSMKNPTLDIRPEPRIPKSFVGPWNNSTYEPDVYRKDLCS